MKLHVCTVSMINNDYAFVQSDMFVHKLHGEKSVVEYEIIPWH